MVYLSSSKTPSDMSVKLPISGTYKTFFTRIFVGLLFFNPINSMSPSKLVTIPSELLSKPYTLLRLHALSLPTKLCLLPLKCQEQPPSTITPERLAFGDFTWFGVDLPKYTNTAISLPPEFTTLPAFWWEGVYAKPTVWIPTLAIPKHALPHILAPKPTSIPKPPILQPNITIIAYIINLAILNVCVALALTKLHLYLLWLHVMGLRVCVVFLCNIFICIALFVLSVFLFSSSISSFSLLSFSITLSLIDWARRSFCMYSFCFFCLFFFSNLSSNLTEGVILVS